MNQMEEVIRSAFLSEGVKNPLTGEPIQVETSPGNYTPVEDERGPVLRTYDGGGFPMDLVIRGQPK
jgi:hypothetical protein